jgi:hypothetical protein
VPPGAPISGAAILDMYHYLRREHVRKVAELNRQIDELTNLLIEVSADRDFILQMVEAERGESSENAEDDYQMSGRMSVPVGDREKDVSQLTNQGASLGEPSSSRVGGSALSNNHSLDTAGSPDGGSGFAVDDGVSGAPAKSDESEDTVRNEPITPQCEGGELSVQKGKLPERLSEQ